jgi:hypothetical protein
MEWIQSSAWKGCSMGKDGEKVGLGNFYGKVWSSRCISRAYM